MKLRGQANATRGGEQSGYAMAVLLVAMSVMAVMLTVAMPVWRQATQREKEEELVFRGKQYAHAIGLFQRKYANAYPPNFDVLVNEKFLRKKFKDPITQDDFAPILVGQQGAGGQQTQNSGRGGSSQTQTPPMGGAPQIGAGPGVGAGPGIGGPGGPGGGTTGGGIMGVTSKSKDKSIRLYNGRSHYNEWQFVYVPQVQAPGQGGAPGAPGPGGQRGNGPNGPGGPGPIGGQRGTGRGPFGPGGGPRGSGPGGQPNGPGRGGFGSPFQPNAPQQPIGAPRGRG